MAANPAGPEDPDDGGAHRPDPRLSQQWLRSSRSGPAAPAERRDALLVRNWLETQLGELKAATSALPGGPRSSGCTAASPAPASQQQPTYAAGEVTVQGTSYRSTPAAAAAAATAAAHPYAGLLDNVAEAVVLRRDDAGFLVASLLEHQEELLSRAQEELCVQVWRENTGGAG